MLAQKDMNDETQVGIIYIDVVGGSLRKYIRRQHE